MFKFVYLFAVVSASPFAYAGLRDITGIMTDGMNRLPREEAEALLMSPEERMRMIQRKNLEAQRERDADIAKEEKRITEEEARIRAEEDREALRVSERSEEPPEAKKQRQRAAAESRVADLESAQTAQLEQREAREQRRISIRSLAALTAGGTALVGYGWAAGDPYTGAQASFWQPVRPSYVKVCSKRIFKIWYEMAQHTTSHTQRKSCFCLENGNPVQTYILERMEKSFAQLPGRASQF